MKKLVNVFNLAALLNPVTYEDSTIRFGLLRYLLKIAFYRVLYDDIHLPCYEEDDQPAHVSVYYQRLYDVQHAFESYRGQLWFAATAILHAVQMNHQYGRKPVNLTKTTT